METDPIEYSTRRVLRLNQQGQGPFISQRSEAKEVGRTGPSRDLQQHPIL